MHWSKRTNHVKIKTKFLQILPHNQHRKCGIPCHSQHQSKSQREPLTHDTVYILNEHRSLYIEESVPTFLIVYHLCYFNDGE